MPRVYSQRREDRAMTMIAESPDQQALLKVMAHYAKDWVHSKPGRKIKAMGSMELGFMFSSGKMAASMWLEMLPAPKGENPFTPATGPIPGLEVKP